MLDVLTDTLVLDDDRLCDELDVLDELLVLDDELLDELLDRLLVLLVDGVLLLLDASLGSIRNTIVHSTSISHWSLGSR